MIMVASYCRVSTDKEDQANSFEAQQRYFKEYIARQPDWELYDVYADEGITGTSTKKRAQFNQMINDARLGKFQLIITKEVSRFSRNRAMTCGIGVCAGQPSRQSGFLHCRQRPASLVMRNAISCCLPLHHQVMGAGLKMHR